MKLIPLTFVAAALPCFGFAQELTAHGQFRHMMHTGDTGGTVALDTLSVPQQAAAHDPAMHDDSSSTLREGGQSAFAAIQEITAALMADPATDWSKVDIEGLRQHLIDMDNVTLRANVVSEPIHGGARFTATSPDPAVVASIQAMSVAHIATMNGVEGWTMQAKEVEGGAVMTVTGPDTARIRGLGFIGIMTIGMHHQTHHLALASGQNPHNH